MSKHSALRLLIKSVALVALTAASFAGAAEKNDPRSFSLSTTETFSPGETVKIQLYAHNEPALEFRVYKVKDVEKFYTHLKDLHSFGTTSHMPDEQIDEETWLEKIHDWKSRLWHRIRYFFRNQFNDEARDDFREGQAGLGKKTAVTGVSEFAQIPLLNESQLVARWKLITPPTLVSETQRLPIENLKQGVYLIEATDGTYKAYTIAIVTQMALVERERNNTAELYVADRKTGAPIADADLALWANSKPQSRGNSDANGFVTLKTSDYVDTGNGHPNLDNVLILAHHGDDVAVITPSNYYWEDDSTSGNQLKAYIYTDRPVYRPGHTVHIKAVIRREKDDQFVLPTEKTIRLRVTGDSDNVILQKDLPVSAHGTISTDVTLANDASLGYYRVEVVGTDNRAYYSPSGNFYVEEYKKPEYKVTVTPDKDRVLQGDKLKAVIEAKYFFGEPVAGAKVTYSIQTTYHYWWDYYDEGDNAGAEGEGEGGDSGDAENSDANAYYGGTEEAEKEGTLDADGRLTVTLPTRVEDNAHDVDYRVVARVTDVSNREVTGSGKVLATYGSYRISVEPTSYVAESGKPVQVKVTATDYDNKPVRASIHLNADLQWWAKDSYKMQEKRVTSADVTTGANGSAIATLNLGNSGDYRITASSKTPENRTVTDYTYVWLWGGASDWYRPNSKIQLITDKKVYAVGDTAHLIMVSDMKDGYAVVTTEGNSLHERKLIHITSESQAFDVPITSKAEPNVIVTATIIKDDKLMTAQKSLRVPPVAETLSITATPSKQTFLPGEKGSFDVLIKDSKGNPVQADFSFGEVDEAIYSIHPDESGDIVKYFYSQKYLYLDPQTSFTFYFTGEAGLKSPMLAKLGDGLFHPRLAEVKPGSDLVVPKVRKAFPDTAYWNPNLRTGSDGHAKVEFNYPDSLTTWRTTIRAMSDDGKAGGTVTRIVVRKNLIVRLAAPRFFRQGDETVVRVIAHNYLQNTKDVTFQLDVKGLDVLSGSTQKITIPARGESYVDWRVRSTTIGDAVLTAKALSNEESDALEQTIPIKPFGVKQSKSSSGKIDSASTDAGVPYSYPSGPGNNIDPATRGITVSLSPSIAGTVFDALDYLTEFPYGCTEQTMSGFLPDVIVAQSVDKLHLKSPIDRPTLNTMVKSGLDRLYSYQHDDGGWGWWPDDQSRVFMTAYVISGMAQAKAAGYEVDDNKLMNGRNWLIAMLKKHDRMLPNLRAYTVYALAISGGAPADSLDQVYSSRNDLTDEGVAFAGLAFDASKDKRADEMAKLLEKSAKTDNSGAHWDSFRDDLLDFYGDNSAETTAFAIELLVARDPNSPLLPKAAEWLATNRPSSYYWYSTKQTAMVVYGLTRYMESSHELGQSTDVQVFVDGKQVGTHHFAPTDAFNPPVRIFIPASQLNANGQVSVKKSGPGVTYWSVDNHWYSRDKKEFHNGQLNLNLTRDYYTLRKKQDKPTDAITYDLVPLTGPVHIGDIIAVKLSLSGTKQDYLLTEDPIPAGTEWLDHPEQYHINSKPDWWGWWFTRREFHDDRAAYFETEYGGQRNFVNLLKVTTAGKFVVSPAQSGPMYQPNIQTTTEPATVEVLP